MLNNNNTNNNNTNNNDNTNLNVNKNNCIPWVERFRPKHFHDIVLDGYNKKILQNIIDTSYFPNLLLYGPPGTGKTTTIINLINSYQEKLNQKNKDLMIHLNASDERGIDIIRNQINQFVSSKPLFNQGMKFVVLDEVDYMTKNAQQALKYLLQNYSNSVRFCLICNYISKIEEGLQNEFLKLRFNQLPEKDIIKFLKNISINENLQLTDINIQQIQKLYKSDIRSMINFMQSNHYIGLNNFRIIDNDIWETLYNQLKNTNIKNEKNIKKIIEYINKISYDYNIDKKNIIKDFLNFMIRNKLDQIDNTYHDKLFNIIENIVHFQDCKINDYVNYSIFSLVEII
jgi:replication factor C subunit 3/5